MRRHALIAAAVIMTGGCEPAVHQMYDQAKYQPLAPSPLFADGNSSRPPLEGTVAHSAGALAAAASGRTRPDDAAQGSDEVPPQSVTLPMLARGRERFGIFCAPCHGVAGYGDGMIARRGFPAPPSYHIARLRAAPDTHLYAVISQGYGVMYPYADRIAPQDRWAIIAYIRALQLSQDVPAASLDSQDQSALKARSR